MGATRDLRAGVKLCKCHGEPMRKNGTTGNWCCRIKRRLSEKAAKKTYRHTPKGRAWELHSSRRKIRIGRRFVGRVKTIAQARIINAHIRRRVRDFQHRQKAEAQCHLAETRETKRSSNSRCGRNSD